MKNYFLLILSLLVQFTYSQVKELNQDSIAVFNTADTITAAITNWDTQKLMNLAPDTSNGTMEFMGPNKILKGKDIYRDQLESRLNRFQYEHPLKSYENIYSCYKIGSSVFPMTIGKYISKQDKTFYFVISLVRFGQKWTIISLVIVDETDDKIQHMLSGIERIKNNGK